MQMAEITIRVPVDDGIKPRDLEAMVSSQLYFLLSAFEFSEGCVYPQKASVVATTTQLDPAYRL